MGDAQLDKYLSYGVLQCRYALGGYDGKKIVSTVEVYDPRFGSWMMSEPMTFSRGYFGSFVYGGKIHVIGGSDDTEVLDTVSELVKYFWCFIVFDFI